MTKAPKNTRENKTVREAREQREMLGFLREELQDLHEIAAVEMGNTGVLPPFYAGQHLGENREVLPLWAIGDEPELAAMLLRVTNGVEPNPELQKMRDELGLTNDWPISELMDTLVDAHGRAIVTGGEQLRDLSVIFPLLSSQIDPAPNYKREEMIAFIAAMKPYAVFVKIPTSGTDETFSYNWDDLEHYHAEVVYADSAQLLDAAVWEYRLNYALRIEVADILAEGGDPEEDLIGQDAAELSAIFDLFVMRSYRLYGSTSPIRAKQEELDVLRDESGDLVVKTPLKPEVEPIPMMADYRSDLEGDTDNVLLLLPADGEVMRQVWPEVRAHSMFSIRIRHGQFSAGPQGEVIVDGYRQSALLEWGVAESLADLYRVSRLTSIYEMLTCCGLVKGKPKPQ